MACKKIRLLKYISFIYRLIYDTISSRLHFFYALKYIQLHGLWGAFKRIDQLFKLFDSNSLSYLTTYYRNKIIYNKIIEQKTDSVLLQSNLDTFKKKPLISILLPTYNSNLKWLTKTIESVKNQIYTNWELCIADDASTNSELLDFLKNLERSDNRIKISYRTQNGHISEASNSALEMAKGEFTALLDHDDLLSEDALYWVAQSINNNEDACLIYSDEDKIDQSDKRQDPYFKCDWNYHLFLSQNLISHLGVYKTSILREIGGFRKEFEGSQDYDVALRFIEKINDSQIIHIPRILYHWRIHKESTALDANKKPYAVIAAKKALEEHLHRKNTAADVEILPNHMYRVKYKLPDASIPISIIIPSKDNGHLLKKCVQSILDKTIYKDYEIKIIDNHTQDKDSLEILDQLNKYETVEVIKDHQPFNFSAINNRVAQHIQGHFICFLNDDTEIISPDWLNEMLSIALQKDVGIVGAKLLYPNHTIQHAGIILGIGGIASHAHKFYPEDHYGYFGRADLIQEFSAVTGACMLVSKNLFDALGGFNEKELAVAYNDVDFCLRAKESGKKVVWTPYAKLFHHESVSRGDDSLIENNDRFKKEIKYMNEKWGNWIKNDPAYSIHLSLNNEEFEFAWPPRQIK